jgi:hypothetical protein
MDTRCKNRDYSRYAWREMENPKLDAALQYKNLCKILLPVASRAADSEDCCLWKMQFII